MSGRFESESSSFVGNGEMFFGDSVLSQSTLSHQHSRFCCNATDHVGSLHHDLPVVDCLAIIRLCAIFDQPSICHEKTPRDYCFHQSSYRVMLVNVKETAVPSITSDKKTQNLPASNHIYVYIQIIYPFLMTSSVKSNQIKSEISYFCCLIPSDLRCV